MLPDLPIMEVACVATLRPELLRTTLYSHAENLFKEHISKIRLILNIDCAGLITGNHAEKDYKIAEILNIANKLKFAEIQYRIVERQPHFGHAWWYVMNQAKTSFIFYLEEDWRLDMEIDLRKMFYFMAKNPTIAHLRLSAFKSETEHLKQWNKFLTWNGNFFEVEPEERGVIGWAGHPSLNRRAFIRRVIDHVNPNMNPEKQIKGRRYDHPMNIILKQYRFGSFHPQNAPPAVVDIGRQWMVDNGFQKLGNKAFFTEWTREGESEC